MVKYDASEYKFDNSNPSGEVHAKVDKIKLSSGRQADAERVSLAPLDPMTEIRALLSTPKSGHDQ